LDYDMDPISKLQNILLQRFQLKLISLKFKLVFTI